MELYNSFLFPVSIVDTDLATIPEKDLKVMALYYRYDEKLPTEEVLKKHNITADEFLDCLSNNGILSDEIAKKQILEMISEYGEVISHLWRWGDGYGGYILDLMSDELDLDTRFKQAEKTKKAPKKAKISNALKKKVFERDKYRCVSCGTHLDLTCDHIFPESKGGETTLENLQTMCRSCNSRKGVKVGENAF